MRMSVLIALEYFHPKAATLIVAAMSVHMKYCLARKQQRNAMGDLPAGDVEVASAT